MTASVVGEHSAVELCGNAPLEASHGFAGSVPLGQLSSVVVAAALSVVADLLQRDEVHGAVELAVARAGEPVAAVVPAGDLDRGDTGVAGEVAFGGEPVDAAGVSENSRGEDRTDPADVGQCAAVFEQGEIKPVLDVGQLAIQVADIAEMVPSQALALFSHEGVWATARRRRVALRSVSSPLSPPGVRSARIACSWLAVRVRCAIRLSRR